jgi:hypothetical protein
MRSWWTMRGGERGADGMRWDSMTLERWEGDMGRRYVGVLQGRLGGFRNDLQ